MNMQQVGGTLNDNPNTIVADIAGNVFLTGNFSGTVDFNPAPGTGTTNVFNLTSVSSDMFLLKIDASGVFGFAYAISTANVDLGKYLALDPNGAVITIGRFQGTRL
ncbi:MAG: SBBP repeat-containing protein [Bacteroidota bacterium]|nr:MAG: SBBP repeat-containing protein [Bacteroidota bacterium]